jgi:pimeloyl-ACP methyl ester carboxylesterase
MTLSSASHGFDILDVMGTASDFKVRSIGYRHERVPVGKLEGKACRLDFAVHTSPDPGPFTVLIHGFGDSRHAWYPYLQMLVAAGKPYKNYIVVELPRHGSTACDQVGSLSQTAETVMNALVTYQAQHEGMKIERVMAASLGVVIDSYLAQFMPGLEHVWIAPTPLLRRREADALLTSVAAIDSRDEVQAFLDRVRTKPRKIPGFALGAVLNRIRRAQPLLKDIDSHKVRQQLLMMDPKSVTIYLGDSDHLVPLKEVDPSFLGRFQGHIRIIDCGHDVTSSCAAGLVGGAERIL